MQGLKTRRLSLPKYLGSDKRQARLLLSYVFPHMREGFLRFQFFNSAGVREFAKTCKVVTRF